MQSTAGEKKSFLQNDRMLVCSMLLFYGLCIVGLIAGTFIWLGQRSKTISANATSTAHAVATAQVNATATAVAHATEQAQYEFIDRFDTNKYFWWEGSEDNEYYSGNIDVTDGSYVWDIRETKKTFIHMADFQRNNYLKDFDVYVDTKILDANPGDACSGLQFRVSTRGWDDGGYYFGLCSDASVYVSYHTEKDGWETIAERSYIGYTNGWNRMEIVARGTHFQFFINGQPIYEMDDDRREAGGMALAVELSEKVPATILFDNFGLQRR